MIGWFLRFCFRLRFSIFTWSEALLRSYDSDYIPHSDFDSVAGENQPLENFTCLIKQGSPRLFQLTGLSFTPDNRFIISLNDKPVNRHKRALHKYSSHENSCEIEHEKQNKSHVQKKRTATETRPSFSPLIQHTKWFSKPKTCSNIKRNYYSNVSQL